MTKSRVPLALGTGSFGEGPTTRIHTVADAKVIVDYFLDSGYNVIDTARMYGGGKSEEFLSQIDIRNAVIDTKVFPWQPGAHSPEKLREALAESEKALGKHPINVYYLHAPDRSIDYEVTLREINEMHKAGHFKESGLSNFLSWEVAEFVMIARKNGWIQPMVYEGLYNAVARTIEPELVSCLKKYGIRFHAYSPLAVGLLTGFATKKEDMDAPDRKNSRFDPNVVGSESFRKQSEPLLPVLGKLQEALNQHDIRMSEAALRWLQHHSALTPSYAVIIGARNVEQLKTNISDSEKGPLPDNIINILDEAWMTVKAVAPLYPFEL